MSPFDPARALRRQLGPFLLYLLAGAVAIVLLYGYHQSYRPALAQVDQALRIDRVERLQMRADATYLREAPQVGAPSLSFDEELRWESVTLPDDWLLSGRQNAVEHYRYHLDLKVPPDRLWAVMLTRVNLNAAVYVNGRLVGKQGRLRDPVTHNWSRPLLFSIPSGLLGSGPNVILVQVASLPAGHGNLGPLLLGPNTVLAPRYDRQYTFEVQLPRVLSGVSAMLTLMIGGIWLLRRQDVEYGWYALAMSCWTLYSLKFHWSVIPVSAQFWAWVLYLGSIGAGVPLYLFLCHLQRRTPPPGQRRLLQLWAAVSVTITVLMVTASPWMFPVANVCYAATLVLVLYGLFRLAQFAVLERSREARWIALTICFLAVFVVYDVVMIFGYSDRTAGELSGYFVPLFLLTFGLITLRRFVAALAEREELLANLEDRAQVAAARVVELETQSALAEQRETIMRDMHDGVGGHLVSSLAVLDRSQGADSQVLRNVLLGALTDLRLMMDSLDTDANDLNLLIGALRERMQPVLRSAGLDSHWALSELPLLRGMTTHEALQILRILQEAMTNAMRHAQARNLWIRTSVDSAGQHFDLSVVDDGDGFDPAQAASGRGLSNMTHRARELGGTLTILCPPGGGAEVHLSLPVVQKC